MRILYAALAALTLSACQPSTPPAPRDDLTFSGPDYRFNVSNITVTQDYRSPKRPPNVEHLSDITPAAAVKQWAGTRMVAAGHGNTLEIDIKDASIVRKDLPKQKNGVEGMFTNEQTEQYNGRLALELKIYSPASALPIARLSAEAERSITLPENAAPIDRERAYHNVAVGLMKAIEPQLDTNIHRYLAPYLM